MHVRKENIGLMAIVEMCPVLVADEGHAAVARSLKVDLLMGFSNRDGSVGRAATVEA